MLDWHSCQICYPLEINMILLYLHTFCGNRLFRTQGILYHFGHFVPTLIWSFHTQFGHFVPILILILFRTKVSSYTESFRASLSHFVPMSLCTYFRRM